MKKYLVLCLLVVLSSQVKASGLCDKYAPFKKAIEFGDPSAEMVFNSTCSIRGENEDSCSNIKICLADIYSTVSMSTIESPRSAETLEKVGIDIGIKDSANTDAVDRAASTCAAEDLFFLRAYGADRIIDSKRSIKLLEVIQNVGERVPKFSRRCAQSKWVMSLSKKDIQNFVADKDELLKAHGLLTAQHFSDTAPNGFGNLSIDLVNLILLSVDLSREAVAQKLNGLPYMESYRSLLTSDGLTPKTSPRISQVDRMLLGLMQLKSDNAGIFTR